MNQYQNQNQNQNHNLNFLFRDYLLNFVRRV